jgi:polyhydroxybutyrate depolymerase
MREVHLVSLSLLAILSCRRMTADEVPTSQLDDGGDSGGFTTVQLSVDSRDRTFLLYRPSGVLDAANMPLMFLIHGGKGTPQNMVDLADFRKIANREKVVLIYPAGVEKSWNDGRPTVANQMGVDDVNFFSKMIDYAVENLPVDSKRVYAAGISNGGFMAARLGCELSEKMVATAAVAASVSQGVSQACRLSAPVAALVIQGTDDPIVPFDGGTVSPGAGGLVLSHAEVLLRWVSLNGCSSTPVVMNLPDIANDGTTIAESRFRGCTNGTEVVGYTVQNGGHTWPQGRVNVSPFIIGKTSQDMNANDVIWTFVSRFRR